MPSPDLFQWIESGQTHTARWRSESGMPPPARVMVVDDTLTADKAYRLACEGTALLWRGDFQNARQILVAMMHRIDRKPAKRREKARLPATQPGGSILPVEAFHQHRLARAQRGRILASLLVPVDADYGIALRRGPDWRQALTEVWGPPEGSPSIVALRELLGLLGAHEWRKNGVEIAALGDTGANRIHPHYGVFSPTRGEYVDLVANVPLQKIDMAFDIGVGTGVLSALLVRRGVRKVVATDTDPRVIQCARENLTRLGVIHQVELREQDMFPPGRAPLVLCNPPWLPARPSAPIERTIYDEGSRMLRAFLAGLSDHLSPGGEGWLILSDLAEHLGLRTRDQLLGWIAEAGLVVRQRHDVRPRHGKAFDKSDALHAARVVEVTSLWRLAAAPGR